MNSAEIKQQYSMRDVIARYGFQPNRAGFIRCPFHSGDREASMKIYEKDFNCFGCSANGDIFTFVQRMENISFKEAFQILGGVYEKPTFESRLAIYKSDKKRQQKAREEKTLAVQKKLNNLLIDVYRKFVRKGKPFSDSWCDSYNALQYQLYIHGELNDMELR